MPKHDRPLEVYPATMLIALQWYPYPGHHSPESNIRMFGKFNLLWQIIDYGKKIKSKKAIGQAITDIYTS